MVKKKYIIKYLGKKLDECEDYSPRKALERIRNKINFEVIEKKDKTNQKGVELK